MGIYEEYLQTQQAKPSLYDEYQASLKVPAPAPQGGIDPAQVALDRRAAGIRTPFKQEQPGPLSGEALAGYATAAGAGASQLLALPGKAARALLSTGNVTLAPGLESQSAVDDRRAAVQQAQEAVTAHDLGGQMALSRAKMAEESRRGAPALQQSISKAVEMGSQLATEWPVYGAAGKVMETVGAPAARAIETLTQPAARIAANTALRVGKTAGTLGAAGVALNPEDPLPAAVSGLETGAILGGAGVVASPLARLFKSPLAQKALQVGVTGLTMEEIARLEGADAPTRGANAAMGLLGLLHPYEAPWQKQQPPPPLDGRQTIPPVRPEIQPVMPAAAISPAPALPARPGPAIPIEPPRQAAVAPVEVPPPVQAVPANEARPGQMGPNEARLVPVQPMVAPTGKRSLQVAPPVINPAEPIKPVIPPVAESPAPPALQAKVTGDEPGAGERGAGVEKQRKLKPNVIEARLPLDTMKDVVLEDTETGERFITEGVGPNDTGSIWVKDSKGVVGTIRRSTQTQRTHIVSVPDGSVSRKILEANQDQPWAQAALAKLPPALPADQSGAPADMIPAIASKGEGAAPGGSGETGTGFKIGDAVRARGRNGKAYAGKITFISSTGNTILISDAEGNSIGSFDSLGVIADKPAPPTWGGFLAARGLKRIGKTDPNYAPLRAAWERAKAGETEPNITQKGGEANVSPETRIEPKGNLPEYPGNEGVGPLTGPERGGRPASGGPGQAQGQEVAPVHKFSSTQVNLPPVDTEAVAQASQRISDADLGGDGRETEPHITVKYGLHTNDVADVRRVLAGEGPITVRMGNVSSFPASESSDGMEVVKVDVDSPDLHRLNKKISDALPVTDTHPGYKPHVTLAYVKPGMAKKYTGQNWLNGREITLDRIVFTGKDGQKIEIPLKGGPAYEGQKGQGEELLTPAKRDLRTEKPAPSLTTTGQGQAPAPLVKPPRESIADWQAKKTATQPGAVAGEAVKPKTIKPLVGRKAAVKAAGDEFVARAMAAVEKDGQTYAPPQFEGANQAGLIKTGPLLEAAGLEMYEPNKWRKPQGEQTNYANPMGSLILSPRPRPSTATVVTSLIPEVEARWQAAKGIKSPSWLQRGKTALIRIKNSFTRHYPHLHPREDAEVIDVLRQFEDNRAYATASATDNLWEIAGKLDPKRQDVLTRSLALPDILKDIEAGLYAGKEIPYGYPDAASIEADLARIKPVIDANPELKSAYENRQRIVRELTQSLVDEELLPKTVLDDPRYFHRQVMEYFNLKETLAVGTGSEDVRTHTKGFQKKRVGGGDFNTDYLQAEYEWMAQAYSQLNTKRTLDRIQEISDIKNQLMQEAKKADVDLHTLIPDDYTAWQLEKGNHFYRALTISEKMADALFSKTADLTPDQVHEVLAMGGKKQEWIIPKRLAKTLDNFRPPRDEGPLEDVAKIINTTWKKWTLLNPGRFASYRFNNQSGDFDASFAYDYGILTHELPGSMRDLKRYIEGQSSAAQQHEMREGIRRGAIDSGISINEIPDVTDNHLLRVLSGKRTLNPAKIYWDTVTKYNNYFENVTRLAAYRRILKKIQNGEAVYGASDKAQVDKIKDPFDKAAKISRELIGDYGNVSEAGQWIRGHLIPFYSWMEINAPRYYRLFKNIPNEGVQTRAGMTGKVSAIVAKRIAKNAITLPLKAGALAAMVQAWNILMYPDDEKELRQSGREGHIILGRDKDGKIRTLRFAGAFIDALDWFGMGDLVSDIKDISSKRATITDKAAEAVKAPFERLAGSAVPLPRALGEAAVGRKLSWPNLMKPGTSFKINSQPIRDRAEHLARSVSLGWIYNKVSGKPMPKDSQGVIPSIANALIYKTDPGEAAYYYIREQASTWMDKQGIISGGGGEPTARSNALYYYKQAVKWGDKEAEKRWHDKYFALGGKETGMDTSVRAAHPLNFLPLKNRDKFTQALGLEDKAALDMALKWYQATYNPAPKSSKNPYALPKNYRLPTFRTPGR